MSGTSSLLAIDGSTLEGGGAIIRLASALSALSDKPIRISNIRAGRAQPGLRTQHLRSLEAISKLCSGKLEGARLGSREIAFYPGTTSEREVRVKIETAGSVGLVLQALLVALLKSKQKTTVEISGGATFGKFAPPTQYVQLVLLPLLRRMGHRGEIHIFSHGFYPVGGARVRMTTEAATDLSGLTLLDRGDIEVIDGVSIAATALKELKVAERQSDATKVALRNEGYDCRIDTEYVESRCPGSGVVLAAKTSTGCVFGADGLGERGKPAEVVGEQAARKLLRTIKSRATLDEYMGDQILPYLALAREESAVTAPRLTMHARTNMFVIKEFTTAEFSIDQHGRNVRIGCVP